MVLTQSFCLASHRYSRPDIGLIHSWPSTRSGSLSMEPPPEGDARRNHDTIDDREGAATRQRLLFFPQLTIGTAHALTCHARVHLMPAGHHIKLPDVEMPAPFGHLAVPEPFAIDACAAHRPGSARSAGNATAAVTARLGSVAHLNSSHVVGFMAQSIRFRRTAHIHRSAMHRSAARNRITSATPPRD